MTSIDLSTGPLDFAGAVSVEPVHNGVIPWRLRHTDRPLIHEQLIESARIPSGVRIVFKSNTQSVRLVCSNPEPQHALIDLVVDGQFVQTHRLATPPHYDLTFHALPGNGERLFEIYLPNFGLTTIHSLAIDDGATASTFTDPRPKWITYGSSITMCRRATSPTRAWPAIVAASHNWNFTSLGFGGQCKFDPIVVHTMANLPADVLSVCLGINTLGADFSTRTWLPAVTGVLLGLRDKHPTTPLIVFSPIFSAPRETTLSDSGLSLTLMREWLKGLVDTFKSRGDRHIAYVDGLDVFGATDAHMMKDELHPEADGIELMGERITRIFAEHLPTIGGAAFLKQ